MDFTQLVNAQPTDGCAMAIQGHTRVLPIQRPPPSTRIVPMPFDEEFVMRARNFERALAGLHCFLHAHADKGYPEAIKLRDAFKRAVDSGGLDEFYEVAGFNQIDPVQ